MRKLLFLLPMALIFMGNTCSTPADGDLNKASIGAPIHGDNVEVHSSPSGNLWILSGEVNKDFGPNHNHAYKGWRVHMFSQGGETKVAYDNLPPVKQSVIIYPDAEMTLVGTYELAIE